MATTSAVYDVWKVLTARMVNLGFPAVDGWVEAPAVWFGDPAQPNPDENGNPPMATERVVVVGMVDAPDVEWATIGQLARAEQWRTLIWVESQVPGRTSTQARDRLRDLTAAIEADVRSIQAGARTGVDQPTEWYQYPQWQVAVERVKPLVYGGPNGYVGQAEVVIGCNFRINTPPRT